MDADQCSVEFEKLAKRLGIDVRYTIDGPSGLCTIKGERVLFVDKNLDARSKIDIFVHEFRSFDLSGVFLAPVIRKLLGMEENSGSE